MSLWRLPRKLCVGDSRGWPAHGRVAGPGKGDDGSPVAAITAETGVPDRLVPACDYRGNWWGGWAGRPVRESIAVRSISGPADQRTGRR